MKSIKRKLTLDLRATYQIKVPGELDQSWADWGEQMTIKVEIEDDRSTVTTLTGTFDQAALQGFLRRLYGMGLPLISAIYIE